MLGEPLSVNTGVSLEGAIRAGFPPESAESLISRIKGMEPSAAWDLVDQMLMSKNNEVLEHNSTWEAARNGR